MHFDWMKIGWALLIVAMIVFLWPRARAMMRQSRRSRPGDWLSVIVPLLFVIGLVALLIRMVR